MVELLNFLSDTITQTFLLLSVGLVVIIVLSLIKQSSKI
jgi:hypothetical protein